MFRTRKELIAYLAGFLDGEGSFGIYPNNNGYMAKISAGQVDLRPLELLQQTFGGSITKDKKAYSSRFSSALLNGWQLVGSKACKALVELRPYLLMKGEQADCLISFQEIIESRRHKLNLTNQERAITDEEYLQMSVLYTRCKRLNHEHGSAATTKREGSDESQASDSLDCTDGKGAEVAEMTTRPIRVIK
jgi:hypothetical protein